VNVMGEEGDTITHYLMSNPLTSRQMEPYRLQVNQLLQSPSLLFWVTGVLGTRVVGEEKTSVHLFLRALGYKMRVKGSCILTGRPAAGKSHVAKSVLRLFPNVLHFSRLTASALERAGVDLSSYVLYIDELQGSEEAGASVRLILSEGELRLVSVEAGEKGQRHVQVLETKGTPVYITTTWKTLIEDQVGSRCDLIPVDESESQTRAILRFQAEEASRPPLPGFTEDETVLRALIQSLEPCEVLVPFLEKVVELFPAREERARRDFQRLIALTEAVTFLHQRQRVKVKDAEGREYLVATPEDFAKAYSVAEPSLKTTLYSLPQRAFDVLEVMEAKDGNGNLKQVSWTARDVAQDTGLSQNRARELLKSLVERGFAYLDDSGKTHMYARTEKKLEVSTILSVVTSLGSFDEKELKPWLDRVRCEIVSGHIEASSTEGVSASPGLETILREKQTEPPASPESLKTPEDGTTQLIVPSLSVSPDDGDCAICGQVRALRADKRKEFRVCQGCYDRQPDLKEGVRVPT